MHSDIIYLIRHGETQWNRDGILQGQLDSPLTEKGQQQIYGIGEYLARLLPNKALVHIECSHLGRAVTSAEIIRDIMNLDKQQLSLSEDLAEIHLGEWQGFNKTQIEAGWPGQLRERAQDRWHFHVPGGENYAHLTQRASRWLAQPRKTLVTIVVSHQQFSNVLRGLYAGLSPSEILRLQHEQTCFFHLYHGNITRYCTGANTVSGENDDYQQHIPGLEII